MAHLNFQNLPPIVALILKEQRAGLVNCCYPVPVAESANPPSPTGNGVSARRWPPT